MSAKIHAQVLTLLAHAWLPMPPSSNNSYTNIQGVGRIKSLPLRDWETEAGWAWKAEGVMPGRAFPKIMNWGWTGEFYFPTPAGRDMDNCYKHITDLIVRVVFAGQPDDRRLVWDQHYKLVDRRRTGVLVRVYEVTKDGQAPPVSAVS